MLVVLGHSTAQHCSACQQQTRNPSECHCHHPHSSNSVRICYSPQCAGTAAATQLHRTRPCQLSLSVISTEDGRFMSSVNVIAEALLRHKKELTTLMTQTSWRSKPISRQPPPQLQFVPLQSPRPRSETHKSDDSVPPQLRHGQPTTSSNSPP